MVVALAWGLCLAAFAPAAPAEQHRFGAAGADDGDVDASGSMTGADPKGGTKMHAARKAVHALVAANVPAGPGRTPGRVV